MNSAPRIHRSIVASSDRLLFIGAFLALASPAPAAVPDGAKTEPKTHTLFMGADLDVELNKVAYRVMDVSGGSFAVKVDGKDLLIPMNEGPVSLRVAHSLKLTEASASIAELKGERVYTPGNDPQRIYGAKQAASAGYSPDIMHLPQAIVSAASGPTSGAPGTAQHNPVTSPEQLSYNAAPQSGQDLNGSDFYARKMQDELAKGLFDAMEISFDVSAEQPLNSPYVVVIAQYREPNTPPGASHQWICAKALEPVDSKPRRVRFVQGGFPQGFQLEKFQIHLYDRGQEVATNVAEKRVPLTRDEAFQYMRIDYVSSHKGASLPATPAMGKLPADLRARLGREQLMQFFYVKVSKDGLPVDAYVDESCSHKVKDPYLESVIRGIRFHPALDKGRPVEGIALLKFADLRL